MFVKYTKTKYVDAMVSFGKVRVSTYWQYIVDENPEVGDADEGQAGVLFLNNTGMKWTVPAEQLDLAAGSTPGHSRFSEPKVLEPGQKSYIVAAGGFNTFMYSLAETKQPSRELMEQFGYDAAVEILDIEAFGTHVAKNVPCVHSIQLLIRTSCHRCHDHDSDQGFDSSNRAPG